MAQDDTLLPNSDREALGIACSEQVRTAIAAATATAELLPIRTSLAAGCQLAYRLAINHRA